MKIVSINVGRPQELESAGKVVLTSIVKAPVAGRVRVRTLNIDGDQQSDLTVHGGPEKAVYLYPSEHYAQWKNELPELALSWGAFGENLTIEGLMEDRACIGDRIRAGSAEFMITQPRKPCFKLGVRFNRLDMVKRFQQSGRHGFYVSVIREGEVQAGDTLDLEASAGNRMSIAAVAKLYAADQPARDDLRRAIDQPALTKSWRDHFESLLMRS